MTFKVYDNQDNQHIFIYDALRRFLDSNGVKDKICTDKDKLTDVFDAEGNFICQYERNFHYFKVVEREWYASEWEYYDHYGMDYDEKERYIKTDKRMNDLIFYNFGSITKVDMSCTQDIKTEVRMPDDENSPYFRRTEVWRHINHTPNCVEWFELEVYEVDENASYHWEEDIKNWKDK